MPLTKVSGGEFSGDITINSQYVTGVSTVINGPLLVGSGTSTGTASQRLQVTGDAYVSSNLGVGVTNPTANLDVSGDLRVRGILYDKDNQPGSTGQILVSTGSGIDWVNTAPVESSVAITVYDEGSIVGTANSISQLNFVGNVVSATGSAGVGIATITFLDYISNSGVSTSVIGGIGSISQLSVSGVTTTGLLNVGTGGTIFTTTGIGSVGIGTTNPTRKLHIYDTTSVTHLLESPAEYSVLQVKSGIGTTAIEGLFYASSLEDGVSLRNNNNNAGIGLLLCGTASGGGDITIFRATRNVVIGNAPSIASQTGTANQKLQVLSGAYVSGNLGVGITNPLTKLDSRGTILIATNSNGNNLLAFGNSTSFGPLNGAPDGSHGNSFILGSSSTDSGAPSYLSFWTTSGGTVAERVRIDSSGKVGIGTSAPSGLIHGYINPNAQLIFQNSNQNNLYVSGTNATVVVDAIESSFPGFIVKVGGTFTGQLTGDGTVTQIVSGSGTMPIILSQGGAERARIDSSGRLLVGTTAARSGFYGIGWGARVQFETTGIEGAVSNTYNENSGTAGAFVLAKSRGSSAGSYTAVQFGDNLGSLSFQGADGTDFTEAASIIAQVDGTPGTNDMPGRLVFSTTADGAASPTERMRITSAGLMGLGTNAPTSTLTVAGDAKIGPSGDTNGYLTIDGATNVYLALTATNGYIGADSNLLFCTNSTATERVRIDSSGNVGIGTNMPAGTRLSVLSADNVAATTIADFGANNGTSAVQIGYNRITQVNSTPSSAYLQIGVSNKTDAIHIDSAGNIGIGTNAPGGKLRVSGGDTTNVAFNGTTKGVRFDFDATQSTIFGVDNTFFGSYQPLRIGGSITQFMYGGVEAARIDSSGRLLVGTSSASGGYLNNNSLVHVQAEGASAGITIHRPTTFSALAGPYFIFSRSRGTPAVIVENGDNLGSIEWGGADGTDVESTAALIRAEVDGTPGANDMPGRLVFFTTADGASTPTERMRITSDGKMGLGTGSPSTYNANLAVYSSGGAFVGALHANASGTFPKASAISLGSDAVSYTYTTGGGSVALTGSAHISALQSASSGAATDIAFLNTSGGTVTEKARIDSSGRLLVGTSSASVLRYGSNTAKIETNSVDYHLAMRNDDPTATPPFATFVRSRSNAAVQSGDGLGDYQWQAHDGTDVECIAASIGAFVDGTPGTNDMPGRLVFSTTADGASTPTERMRITSDGRMGIGANAPSARLQVTAPSASRSYSSSVLDFSNIHLDGITADTTTSALTFTSGGGGGAAIAFSRGGSYDTEISFWTNSALVANVATQRMVIDSAGRLGLGTGSPVSLLHVNGDIAVDNAVLNTPKYIDFRANAVATEYGGIRWYNFQWNNTIRAAITSGPDAAVANGYLAFATGVGGNDATERARIDSSGRLLVGTSASVQTGDLQAINQIFSNAQSEAISCHLGFNANPNSSPVITLSRSRNTTYGSYTIVQSADSLGRILFVGDDGASYANKAAKIECFVDGTPGVNDMPGRLVFSTTLDGQASPTEAMRINNQRELLIGTTTRTANGGVLQISNGITFPGTQSACSDPNTLDDYEEGTWTPTIIGTSVAGTGTYAVQQAKYTKIGRIVYIQARIDWTAHTGTGAMRISGLPFAVSSSASTPAISIIPDRMTSPASTFPQAYALNSTSDIVIVSTTIAGGGEANLAIDTDAGIRVGGWYEV